MLLLFTYLPFADAQLTYLVRDIRSFGAKGNGRADDHDAFQRAAAFFNACGRQGKLVISKVPTWCANRYSTGHSLWNTYMSVRMCCTSVMQIGPGAIGCR